MFGTATIAVTSEPSGAVIRIDGRQRGVTPNSRLELAAGNHRLEVEHTHYATYREGLSLQRGDHLVREVTFQVGEGTYQLLSNPRGAWVEVDGERLPDATPTQVTISSGPHEIAMGLAERRVVTETRVLNDGEQLEVNFNLNIDPHGSLTVTTAPQGARIEFIGEDIAYTPKVRVPIGEYAIRVSKTGYVAQEFRYDVRYGDNLHHVDLKREFATLNVQVVPADAEVTVHYQDGQSPRSVAYKAGMQLPTGQIEVRARAVGRRTAFKTVRLSGAGATVHFSLPTIEVEPGKVITDQLKVGGEGPAMVVIAAGSFAMGDANGPPSERPVRTVTLTQPFAVSRYEITVGEYVKFAQASDRALSAKLDQSDPSKAVAHVTHNDAQAYAAWLTRQTGKKYRLLSEAEWEYVARAGSTTDYFFGNDPLQLCRYANVADLAARQKFREWDVILCDDKLVRPGPVGTYEPNPFGLYDIYGNVAEWVLDCGMPAYVNVPRDGAPGVEVAGCGSHGVRGGSWDSLADEARSAYRNTASSANDDRGIRLLREL
jgi:formylglycine-generating enzyme required for sulfatase activity